MGQYHYLINLTKKQVIHPHRIGNGLKLHEQVGWPCSTSTALVMLLSASSKDGGRGGGDFRCGHPLVGSWAGDRIAFIGDYAEKNDIPNKNAKQIHDLAELTCYPGEREYGKEPKPKGWEQWKDISADVRDMMSQEFGISYKGSGWLEIVDNKKDTEN